MRALTIGLLASLAWLLPGVAAAQSSSKLAIGTLRGDSSVVRRQILLQVCGPYQCVAASRYTTDDRPDPEKLAAGGVTGYLGGAVTGAAGNRHVILTLTTPTTTAKKPARTWRLRLGPDGKLRPQVLERFAIEMDELLQASAARLPPAPTAPPQRAPPPAAKPAPPPPPPAAKPPPARAPAQAEPAEKPRARPQPTEPREREREPQRAGAQARLRGAAEVGLWVTSRKLTYSGATGGSLRTYDASAVFVPRLRLEGYAAAFGVKDPLLAGLGVYVDYGHSVGLKVKPPSGDPEGTRDGTLTALDVGVAWRVRPISGSGFALVPAMGYRSVQVTTSPEIEFLPDTRLSGYAVRLDLDAPVTPKLRVLAGGGFTLWTQAKDLVKGGYFGKGSARGYQVEGGAQYRFFGPLHAKVMIEWQNQRYSGLGEPAAGVGDASGASDSYFGARFMLRGEF